MRPDILFPLFAETTGLQGVGPRLGKLLNNLAGPIGIADQAGKTAELGLFSYLSFLAVLSVSLGVINLFPLPMLDGGHIVFHLYELILGKKLPERVIVKAQQIGMIFLLGLMQTYLN